MKILFQDGLEQLKKVRGIVKNLGEAEKLAVCLNHWSDDDSWGGSFSFTEFTADYLYNDWFLNMFTCVGSCFGIVYSMTRALDEGVYRRGCTNLDVLCNVQRWMLMAGITMTFAPIFAKW